MPDLGRRLAIAIEQALEKSDPTGVRRLRGQRLALERQGKAPWSRPKYTGPCYLLARSAPHGFTAARGPYKTAAGAARQADRLGYDTVIYLASPAEAERTIAALQQARMPQRRRRR